MQKDVSNWGKFPEIKAKIYSAGSNDKLKEILRNNTSVLARGNGRCYGDAALNSTLIDSRKLDKFLSFDENKGVLVCESGVLLSEIIEFAVPKGYFIPVTPGTKFITVGGALASDVHGKNHHSEGCFSDHVLYADLLDGNGEIKRISPTENTELFWSTVGGMGLTGIIISCAFKLKKIESSYIRQESIKARNLEEIFQLFEESEDWTYTVAWIDCLQKGKNIGRSILMRGEHAKNSELNQKQQQKPLVVPQVKYKSIPFDFPSFVLNTLTVKIFNFLFYNKLFKKKTTQITSYDSFFYPLDAVHDWNRIYGKNGFIQYQFVIPKEKGLEGMRKILQTISSSGEGSFLAVLKLFGKNNPKAFNSFPMEGYTLALDFKVNDKLPQLVEKLDNLVYEFGGRIYRAKDSMSQARLTNYLKNIDSDKFESLQNKRIKENIC